MSDEIPIVDPAGGACSWRDLRMLPKSISASRHADLGPADRDSRSLGYGLQRVQERDSGKGYVKIADRVPFPWYEDRAVSSGRTYFYVVTALDPAGNESGFSAETKAVIP